MKIKIKHVLANGMLAVLGFVVLLSVFSYILDDNSYFSLTSPVQADSHEGGGGDDDGCEGTKLGVPLEDGTDCIPPGSSLENNPIFVYLRPVIQFLTAGAGLAIVIMIIISGIRYITSSGNPQAVQAAKSLLGKAIGALLLFIFMFALFNYLIPGGIIG